MTEPWKSILFLFAGWRIERKHINASPACQGVLIDYSQLFLEVCSTCRGIPKPVHCTAHYLLTSGGDLNMVLHKTSDDWHGNVFKIQGAKPTLLHIALLTWKEISKFECQLMNYVRSFSCDWYFIYKDRVTLWLIRFVLLKCALK